MTDTEQTQLEESALTVIGAQPSIPITQRAEFRNEFDVQALLEGAGKLTITPKQQKILFAPVDPDAIEIRPDGIVYLPWEEYAKRLTQAFPMQWALIPQGLPKFRKEDGLVVWGAWLVIQGHLMGFAIGEVNYQSGNRTMTIADAWEGAVSNALMRLCKRNGISLELWTPSYIREWKENYAESYQGERGTKWRKRAQPLRRMSTPEGELKNDMREFWAKRTELISRMSFIPYFGGNKPHILATLVKLTSDGGLTSKMTDEEVMTVVTGYAMQRADEQAAREAT